MGRVGKVRDLSQTEGLLALFLWPKSSYQFIGADKKVEEGKSGFQAVPGLPDPALLSLGPGPPEGSWARQPG